MQDKKENLKKQYKDNNGIIKYDDFSKLIQKEEIYMENLANEYLLYKMKKDALNKNSLEKLDIKVFLDFYEKEEKIIKEDKKPIIQIYFKDENK